MWFSDDQGSCKCSLLLHLFYHSRKHIRRQQKYNFIIIKWTLLLFSHVNLLCMVVILAAILVAILDLEATWKSETHFNGVIASGMVKNIHLDTKILPLSSILIKLWLFFYIYCYGRWLFRRTFWRPYWILWWQGNL